MLERRRLHMLELGNLLAREHLHRRNLHVTAIRGLSVAQPLADKAIARGDEASCMTPVNTENAQYDVNNAIHLRARSILK